MAGRSPSAGEMIAAVLLPPLAVYLARGLGPMFAIATLLTLLWWVPGVIFAFVTIFASDSRIRTIEGR